MATTTGVLFAVFLLAFTIFLLYKAIYDIFTLSRKALIRRPEEAGYSEIHVSNPSFEDTGNYFAEKTMID